jgi:O-methyltransferase
LQLTPSIQYALHPYLPERLGFRRLLRVVNPEAARLLDRTDDYTLVIARSRVTLMREGGRVIRAGVPGDFVEFGVHRGGTAGVLAHTIKDTDRHLHLFDRWGDLPEPTEEDGFRQQQYARANIPDKLATLGDVFDKTKEVVEEVIGFPKDRLHYYPGWYDDTLDDYPGRPIAFASIDCDYYDSVKPVLALCERYASPGAVLYIDDYAHWPGAKRAVHEWLENTKRRAQLINFWRVPNAIIRLLD